MLYDEIIEFRVLNNKYMDKQKVLLIGGSPIKDSPYINSYIDIFEKNNIPFDFVYWNKHLDDISNIPNNYIPYNHFTNNRYPWWIKIFEVYGFYRFAKNVLAQNKFSYIVVFTIAHAIYFDVLFMRKYKGSFIFDIRDYSPICEVVFLKKIVNRLVFNSAYTVISSQGFLKWLPKHGNNKFIVSHNTNLHIINDHINSKIIQKPVLPYNILTIGQLRDTKANSLLIDELANNNKYNLIFSGIGIALPALRKNAEKLNSFNVLFSGRYDKADENSIVENSDMINIYFTRDTNSDTLMSNRFYLSVLFRKPMIVNDSCYQAGVVKKYSLGVVIRQNQSFDSAIEDYWKSFNNIEYEANCIRFLNDVKVDIYAFEKILVDLYFH